MQELHDVLDPLQLAVFVGLGVIAYVQWRRQRGAAAARLAATFGVLAAVALGGRFIPQGSHSSLVDWVQKLELVILALFPYLLYRFMASFDEPPRWMTAVAVSLTGTTMIATLIQPRIPEQGETARPPVLVFFILVLLVDWVVLSVAVAVRLWRAGRGQPTVARRRMRTLSLGSIGLALVLVVAGAAAPATDVTWSQVFTQILGIASAVLFLLGFAPPGIVRLAWRRQEEKELRDAELGLMEAVNPSEVGNVLLPHVSRLVGGRGAILVGPDGNVTGAYGLDATEAAALADKVEQGTGGDPYSNPGSMLSVPLRSGAIAVQASTYTPFFGREETEMLQTLAVLAELALARGELFGRERDSREQLAEAQKIARIGSWKWDLETNEIAWSDEMYRIYGLDPDTFQPSYEALSQYSPDRREVMHFRLKAAIEDDVPLDAEQRIVRPDGTEVILHARGEVVRENDKPVRMIGTAQDITERKKQEAFREQFIANAAHELRTPMTTLVGFVEMMARKRSAMPEEQIEVVIAAMSRSGDRLAVLINNLLDLSKLQQGELDFVLAPVPLKEVLETAHESTPPPPDKTVEVQVDGHPVALADRHRLDQVISNLLTNAYRYGGPNIRIEACEDDGAIVVTVADNGTGIEPALVSNLFDPFTRGASSSEFGGSGLGLAIVKMLVDASGGEIWHEPETPHGTRFNVRLKRSSS